LRSLDSYLVKNDRGDVNRENRAFDDTYWRERNDGAYLDDSILRYAARLHAEIARLKSLPEITDLHEKSVFEHCAKRDILLAQESYREMQAQLRAAPPFAAVEAQVRAELGHA
jgi:hypothetical protein